MYAPGNVQDLRRDARGDPFGGSVDCPICGVAASGGHNIGDSTVIICTQCGGYRLSGTAIALLEKGTLKKPDPAKFREVVKKKRGKSSEYPLITQGDLGG